MTAGTSPLPVLARMRALPHYVWVGLVLAVLLAGLYWVSRPAPVKGAHQVRVATASVPSQPGLGEVAVTLPHILDDEPPDWQSMVDYRVPWPAELHYQNAADTRLAVLLPRVGTRFRVLLNGQELHNVGWRAPEARTVNSAWFPYLVSLPSALLASNPADNRLDIQVRGELLERSGLWPLHIGDHDVLAERYRSLYGWQVTGTWMMVMTALLMAFMAAFLWGIMRERLFGLMALASLAHAVRLVLSVVAEPPLSFDAYFLLHRISFTVYCGFLYLFIEDLFGLRLRLARSLAIALLVVGPAWMVVTLLTRDYDLYRMWAGVLAVVAFVILSQVTVLTGWGRRMTRDQILVMVVAGFTFVTGLRDFLVVQLNFPGDADIRWMSIGSLALMLTLGWVLLQRSTESIREVRRLNETLAEKVAEREADLRAAFEQLRASEQQRAIENERRRLMRDMHDGLGSQLVQTLNMVRSQREGLDRNSIASMIHHALEELRMTLDSLEPMEGDLPTILGTLRQRIAPALDAAGIELDWQVEEVPAVPGLDSRGVMHLFRCVQEAFANVVRHANATRVTVRTWSHEGVAYLAVADNGCGLPPREAMRQGARGLMNIRVRAEKIGATVRFYDAQPGTGIEFAFVHRYGAAPHESDTDWMPLSAG